MANTVVLKEAFAQVVADVGIKGLLQSLAETILSFSNDNWTLQFPATTAAITNLFTLKHTLTNLDEIVSLGSSKTGASELTIPGKGHGIAIGDVLRIEQSQMTTENKTVTTATEGETDTVVVFTGTVTAAFTDASVKTVTTKDVFTEFYRPTKVERPNEAGTALGIDADRPNYFYMEVVFGTGTYTDPTVADEALNFTTPGAWGEDKASVRSRFSWFKESTTSNIKKWLPVQYWVSLTDTRIAIVLAGDASANKLDRLISFGYFGEVTEFSGDTSTHLNNFAVSVGSDIPPGDYLIAEEKIRYSDKTGTGVTDITMLGTYIGFPMQAHFPALTTPDEFIDKKLEGPSNYTKKYHMTPVYIFHNFDGYRGELEGVIATDRSTVVNLDDLIHKYNAATGTEVNPDKQKIYKTFLVNSPYSLLNNATNVLYGLAVLKETGDYPEV